MILTIRNKWPRGRGLFLTADHMGLPGEFVQWSDASMKYEPITFWTPLGALLWFVRYLRLHPYHDPLRQYQIVPAFFARKRTEW